MVDGINGFGDGKEWKKLDSTTQDSQYKKGLDKTINSILNGKESISIEKLRKNSLFSKMSDKAEQRLEYLAGIDGDNTTLNSEELRVLMTLSDATLKDNSFVFDGKFNLDNNSGLEQATDNEVALAVKNLVTNNAQKKMKSVDVSKYDRSKDFATKVTSEDVDESMLAIQDKLDTGFVNKKTGKNVSLPQAVALFTEFVENSYRKDYADFYNDVCVDFENETGIPVKNFDRLRCMGDGDSFVIGDWQYDRGNVTNTKTGEKVQLQRLNWYNTAENTVPAADGKICLIKEYNDGKGTIVQYNYDDPENVAPTGSNITVDGKTSSVSYQRKDFVDPNLYNFTEN